MFLGTETSDGALAQAPDYLPKPLRRGLQALTALAAALVLIPTVYLVVWSLWGTEVPGRLRTSPTGTWFTGVLSSRQWLDSLAYSAVIAIAVGVAGTLANCCYVYFSRFTPAWIHVVTFVLMTAALLNPVIAYGMSLRLLGSSTGSPEWLTVTVGHLVVVLPIQYFILEAAQERTSREMIWAGRTLGASHWGNFFAVFVPLNRLAIIGAFVVGFFVSFDEVVTATFVILSSFVTTPLRLWQGASHMMRPDAAVVSTLLLVATAAVGVFLVRPREFRIAAERGLKGALAGFYKEILVGLGCAGVTWAFLPRLEGFGGFVGNATVSLVMGTLAGLAFSLWKARRCLAAIVQGANPEGFDGIPRAFAYGSIQEVVRRTELLRAGSWIDVSVEENRILANEAFSKNEGRYLGTDRNVPSRFKQLYPGYLRSQLKRSITGGDVRIALYDFTELKEDYRCEPGVVREFIKSHQAKGVMLLLVPWAVAERKATGYGLPSPDLGVFDWKTAVFFDPPEERSTGRIQMRDINVDLVQRLESYLTALAEDARELVLQGHEPYARPLSQEALRDCKSLLRKPI